MKALLASLLITAFVLPPALADSPCGDPLTATRGDRSNVGRAAITRENEPSVVSESGLWYIVGPVPTGPWTGHSNEWAFGDGVSWAFEPACIGDTAAVDADHIRLGIAEHAIYDSHLSFDGAGWYVSSPGFGRYDEPFNSNLTIAAPELETAGHIRLYKNDSNAYTWTLPHAVNDFYGVAPVVISNDGAAGNITVIVANTPSTGLAGLIDGATSLTVTPQSSKAVIYVRNDGRGRWHTF